MRWSSACSTPSSWASTRRTSLALVDVLERWSRGQAADVLHQVMTIALGVAVCTLIPALFLGGRQAQAPVTAGSEATPAPPPR